MAEVATEGEFKQFIGPKAPYYLAHWNWSGLFDGKRVRADFNWAAFFLFTGWLGYRKMYKIAVAFAVLYVAEFFLVEQFMFDGNPPLIFRLFIFIVLGGVTGFFGNQWYYAYVTNTVRALRQMEPAARKKALKRRGDTSWVSGLLAFFAAGIIIALVENFMEHWPSIMAWIAA